LPRSESRLDLNPLSALQDEFEPWPGVCLLVAVQQRKGKIMAVRRTACIRTGALEGIDGMAVMVEIDISRGLPGFHLVVVLMRRSLN